MIPLPLIRACLRLETEPETDLAANLTAFRQCFEPSGAEGALFRYIGTMFDRAREVPSLDLVRLHFVQREALGDGEGSAVLSLLDTLTQRNLSDPIPLLTGTILQFALDRYRETLMQESLTRTLVEASTILSTGVPKSIKQGSAWVTETQQGADAAMLFLNDSLDALHRTIRRGSIEGDFQADGDTLWQSYAHAKANPDQAVGVLSGIHAIDAVHQGLRRGELALVLGFVSHLKSSLCLNWLYRASVYQGKHGAIASMEMSVSELRRVIFVIHANHPRFKLHPSYGQVTVDKVRFGTLSDDEEDLLRFAIEDFTGNPAYGLISYKEPQESLTMDSLERWAISVHRHTPLDLLVVDYLGLMDPNTKSKGMEQGSMLNIVIRQAKTLAMSFDRGRGIPILSPHQANREGWKAAEKNGGRYTLSALANAHEAERSTDLVYTTYLDDAMRGTRELQLGNLKNRNGPLITVPFRVFADPATRVIDTIDAGGSTDSRQRVTEVGF